MKAHIETAFPEMRLMNIKDCLDSLGWSYSETENGFENVKCCDEKVKFSGWIGTEHGYCSKCGKGMQDMTGILPNGSVTVGMIDFEKFDITDGRIWSPENVWGLKA